MTFWTSVKGPPGLLWEDYFWRRPPGFLWKDLLVFCKKISRASLKITPGRQWEDILYDTTWISIRPPCLLWRELKIFYEKASGSYSRDFLVLYQKNYWYFIERLSAESICWPARRMPPGILWEDCSISMRRPSDLLDFCKNTSASLI